MIHSHHLWKTFPAIYNKHCVNSQLTCRRRVSNMDNCISTMCHHRSGQSKSSMFTTSTGEKQVIRSAPSIMMICCFSLF